MSFTDDELKKLVRRDGLPIVFGPVRQFDGTIYHVHQDGGYFFGDDGDSDLILPPPKEVVWERWVCDAGLGAVDFPHLPSNPSYAVLGRLYITDDGVVHWEAR